PLLHAASAPPARNAAMAAAMLRCRIDERRRELRTGQSPRSSTARPTLHRTDDRLPDCNPDATARRAGWQYTRHTAGQTAGQTLIGMRWPGDDTGDIRNGR